MLRSEFFTTARVKMLDTARAALNREAEWLRGLSPQAPSYENHASWLAVYTKRILCAHTELQHVDGTVKCNDCGSNVRFEFSG